MRIENGNREMSEETLGREIVKVGNKTETGGK